MFGSVTVVRFGCREPGSASFIELRPARVRRIVLNGQDLDPVTLQGNRLPLPGLREANELRVEADMPYSRSGAGLHRFTDASLRRLLADQLDDLRRALQVRSGAA